MPDVSFLINVFNLFIFFTLRFLYNLPQALLALALHSLCHVEMSAKPEKLSVSWLIGTCGA